jgi:hypothetical protein
MIVRDCVFIMAVGVFLVPSCTPDSPVSSGPGSSNTTDHVGGGDGTSGGSFPKTVKLQGTIELSKRTYDHAGGKVVIERTAKGSFSGTSTASDLGSVLHYTFDQPFTVTGTQKTSDVTLTPNDCTKDISGSTGAQLELYVGANAGGYVAQLAGDIQTTTDGTCTNGANVESGFVMNLPSSACPDPTIKVLSGANWLVTTGDPHTGFDLSQDITCDSATVKISISVEGL